MFVTLSLHRRATTILALAAVILCAVGVVLLQSSGTGPRASASCHERPSGPASPAHRSPASAPPSTQADTIGTDGKGGSGVHGDRVLTARDASLQDARSLARQEHVSVALALSRLREQSRLDDVMGLLKARYPDTYADSYIAQSPYRTVIRFCGGVPAGAHVIASTHHLRAVFEGTVVASEPELDQAVDRVTNAVARFSDSAGVDGDVKTDTVHAAIGYQERLTVAKRAEIEQAAHEAAGGFLVSFSYLRGPVAIGQ